MEYLLFMFIVMVMIFGINLWERLCIKFNVC